MTRDYKHKVFAPKKVYQRRSQVGNEETVSKESRVSLKLFWVAVVFMSIGLLGGFFIVQHFAEHGVKSDTKSLKNSADNAIPEVFTPVKEAAEIKPEPEVQVAVNQLKPQSEKDKVQYTFYQGLAKTEVVVDVEPLSVKLKVPYFIQAGTFTSEEQAIQEQQRIKQYTELNLTVSSIIYQKRHFYRLRLGPFEDRLELNKKRNELRQLGVDTLLIRQKN